VSRHISAIKPFAPRFEAFNDFARFLVAFVHWSLNDTASRRNQGSRILIPKIPVISSPYLPELIWMGRVCFVGGFTMGYRRQRETFEPAINWRELFVWIFLISGICAGMTFFLR
jgi:hypothetical protein